MWIGYRQTLREEFAVRGAVTQRIGQKFSLHLFFCTKELRIVIANRTGYKQIVNIKYCICRDHRIGDENVQIKLEILKPRSYINNLAWP